MIRGFDWASYQQDIDAEAASRAGYAFAIGKATEGTNYVNPFYAENTSRVRTSGILAGHYHFYRRGDAIGQAQLFRETTGALPHGEFPAIDFEDPPPADGPPLTADDGAQLATIVAVLQHAGNPWPLIYSNQDVITRTRLIDYRAILGNCGLWLAAWQDADPTPVPPWSFVAFWQHAVNVSIPGVSGKPTQEDYFNGSLVRLPLYGAK